MTMDIHKFYDEYTQQVAARPGYPTRAAWKSLVCWRHLVIPHLAEIGDLLRVADVGGCYGFSANAFVFHGQRVLNHSITADVYELAEQYTQVGQLLFPWINFENTDFRAVSLDAPYDVTLMFDVLEHLPDPGAMLAAAVGKSRFLLIKTPLETTEKQLARIAAGLEEPIPAGTAHRDGHLHFFTLKSFFDLLNQHWEMVDYVIPPPSWTPLDLIAPEFVALTKPKFIFTWQGVLRFLIDALPKRFYEALYIRRVIAGATGGNAFILARPKKHNGTTMR